MVYKPCPECDKHNHSNIKAKVRFMCLHAPTIVLATGDVVKFCIINKIRHVIDYLPNYL